MKTEDIHNLFKQITENEINEFDFIVYEFFYKNLKSGKGVIFNPRGLSIKDCISKFDEQNAEILEKFKVNKFDKNTWQKSRKKIEELIIPEIGENNCYKSLSYLYERGYIHILRDLQNDFKENQTKLNINNLEKFLNNLLNKTNFENSHNVLEFEISNQKKIEQMKYFDSIKNQTNIPIKESEEFQKKIDYLSKFIVSSIRGYLDIKDSNNIRELNNILSEIKEDLESL